MARKPPQRKPVTEANSGIDSQPKDCGTGFQPVSSPRRSALLDTRIIYCGDCLEKLKALPDDCIDLIYIDPPFNSNRNYEVFWGETKEKRAFEDRHASTQAYIDYMRPRCVELARVLNKTGSFYYHCDWHASHYVKVMLDQVFGENNFKNEVVWKRTTAHNDPNKYGNNVDSIFFYTGGDAHTWNPVFLEHGEEYKARFRNVDPDGRRWTDDNLTAKGLSGGGYTYEYKGVTSLWRCPPETMAKLDAEGRLHFTSRGGIRLKRYWDENKGASLQALWDDIQPINSQATEKLGYPTQKPLALLNRIVSVSSNPNDIVLDAFCGCGTALVAAENLGRQWIGIDISPTACRVMAKRLRDVCKLREDEALWRAGRGFVVRDLPWTIAKLREIPPFEFENWAVIALGGIPNKTQVGDMGIDGRIFPVASAPAKDATPKGQTPAFGEFLDHWYPIQVKQKGRVGRPDIDAFEAVMMREDRERGFFVSFDYSSDAVQECANFYKRSGKIIKLITVREILDELHVQKM
jgi:site-specific DNA-methyltransferase (adenine-specific)